MDRPANARQGTEGHAFRRVPIELRVSVGRAWPTIDELLALEPQAVLPLDKGIEDPVDIYIGDRLIARGHLEELDGDRVGQIAVRLTEVAADGQSI